MSEEERKQDALEIHWDRLLFDDRESLRLLESAVESRRGLRVIELANSKTTSVLTTEQCGLLVEARRVALAAPDLLRALEEAVKTTDSPPASWLEAIEKARGKALDPGWMRAAAASLARSEAEKIAGRPSYCDTCKVFYHGAICEKCSPPVSS